MESLCVVVLRSAYQVRAALPVGAVKRALVAGSCFFGLAFIAGCDSSSQESRVSGRVTLDGDSVGPGMIVFSPAAVGGTPATGSIETDGTYSLETNHEKGLAAGKYKVALMVREPPDFTKHPIRPPPGKSLIPEKYEQAGTSGLEFEVEPGRNTINIELRGS
jgi:hypothetical protein